ncbi:MAG: oligosaccharide flippase family protein [Anaerolineae bacterium]|nr:oligosaccharide flippase family protein [Anaerolineae bacterium]
MTIGYGTVQWAGPLLSFIFTPIITRILSPSDYGVADFALTVASALGVISLFAMPQTLMTHFNDQPNEEWQRRLLGSVLTLALIIGIPIGLLIFLLAPSIAQHTYNNLNYAHLFQLIGGAVTFGVIMNILPTAAQAKLKIRWGMIFSATTIMATVIGNILFIIVLRLGATGIILTPVFTSISVSLVSLLVMHGLIGRPSLNLIKMLFYSGAVLFPTLIASWALLLIDRFFLINYVSTEALGYYAIAGKVASLLQVMIGPIVVVWTPLSLSFLSDPISRQRYAIMSRYFISVVLIGGLGLGLFAQEILRVFTRVAYLPAAPYVGFLAYIYVFSAISTVLYTNALADKRLKEISIATVIGAVVNIISNFILIPQYGVWGATVATLIGYGIPVVLLYFLLRKRFPIPYPIKKLTIAIVVQFCLLIVGLFLPQLTFSTLIIVKLLLVLCLPSSFLLLGLFTPFEIWQGWLVFRGLMTRRVPDSM